MIDMTNQQAFAVAKINPELKDFVLSSMPQNLNRIEQSIFVYAKLCSILNYDPEYAASGRGEGPKQKVHKDIDYVEQISLNNTDVVCYNFNIIFGKILEELGIDFKIFSYTEKSNIYGNHSDLSVSFSENDIPSNFNIDYGKIIFYGHYDMKHIKIDHKLNFYTDHASGHEFVEYTKQISQGMVQLVLKQQEELQRKQTNFDQNNEKIKALESEYLILDDDFKELAEKDAFKIFVNQVKDVNMNRYDATYYIGKIFKNLLPSSQEKLCTYSILREKTANNSDLYNMIGVINILNGHGDFFFKLTPPNAIENISKHDLQEAFNEGRIDYIPEILSSEHILPTIHSATIDETFKQKIDIAKKLKAKTIEEFKEWKEDYEGSDIRNDLPNERIFKYAKVQQEKEIEQNVHTI